MKFVSNLLVLLSAMALAGCHWFDDSDKLSDCPLNSQYPCPCTSHCENDQICVQTQGNEGSYGQCTLPCYGEDRICRLASTVFENGICLDDGYCAVTCLFDEDCPAGMGCDADICTPGELLDSGVTNRANDTSIHTDTDTQPLTTDTATADTATVESTDTAAEILRAQREAECTDLCNMTFKCWPSIQTSTLVETINACVAENWHATSVGLCQLNCITDGMDCATLANCNSHCR